MPRVAYGYRTASKIAYNDFCKKNPTIKLDFQQWKKIIYGFNYSFRDYILETGYKAKLPLGLGEFSINKKRIKKINKLPDGREFLNLPIDWKKSKEKGKRIYNFNYHTEGFRYGWVWFKKRTRIKQPVLWYFKASRITSRLLAHYLNIDKKYQHLYLSWNV